MFDFISTFVMLVTVLISGPLPSNEPTPEPEVEVITPAPPKHEMITPEENDAEVENTCTEWNKPDHGSWALDPGDTDQEYTDTMNEMCTPVE